MNLLPPTVWVITFDSQHAKCSSISSPNHHNTHSNNNRKSIPSNHKNPIPRPHTRTKNSPFSSSSSSPSLPFPLPPVAAHIPSTPTVSLATKTQALTYENNSSYLPPAIDHTNDFHLPADDRRRSAEVQCCFPHPVSTYCPHTRKHRGILTKSARDLPRLKRGEVLAVRWPCCCLRFRWRNWRKKFKVLFSQ